MITVAVETPRREEVAALLRHSDAVAAALYPGQFRRAIDPASLDCAGISLLVARHDGRTAGCCALFDREDGSGELKRMIVAEAHRRQGIGEALLRGAEALAIQRGIALLLLEVGIRNDAAYAMYRRGGFTPRGPFAPYTATPISRFLEKRLVPGISSLSPLPAR
ncbi:GNAT family N-acetyltransferase [Roseomonas sp. HJA6]|uniref:GNAT family N-acetyltransferase n=1 Tax=Roseomonas alba TaxID=2846776 RepID=A0ABS7AGQ7_9PROT|nr:GNAT family N-acetyltransferase [Neoroseomonas alba]